MDSIQFNFISNQKLFKKNLLLNLKKICFSKKNEFKKGKQLEKINLQKNLKNKIIIPIKIYINFFLFISIISLIKAKKKTFL